MPQDVGVPRDAMQEAERRAGQHRGRGATRVVAHRRAVDTTDALDVAGRLGVAALPPAEPQTAAVAAALLEPALASLRLGGAAPASDAGGTA